MRSLADRLETVNRTLLPSATSHPAETAWPMTHLVAIAADASDEVLFRTADPGADRAALAAFAAAVAGTAQALAVVADSAKRLLTAPPAAASPAEADHAHSVARALVTTTARELSSAADRVSTEPVAAVTDLSSHRGAQAGAALARSRIVSVRPASPDSRGDAAPAAPVIPLRRNR
ncbi:hypothetical protein ACFVVX_15405 [Kitasatospora sp. NPDC058170]|uniref:hypothetical protein n=1 Tax=Kitasatospora sp. NPDC058170 TaxID=3346364 RepID=UPI0036DD7DFE